MYWMWDLNDETFFYSSTSNLKVIDTKKYDVIEKKDYKKVRLESEITRLSKDVEYCERQIALFNHQLEVKRKEKEKVIQELKDLENEPFLIRTVGERKTEQ
jgi:hypothetical protein